jgi:branched-chain amino acid aminotransferase
MIYTINGGESMQNQISPVTIKDGNCFHTELNIEFSSPPVYEVIRVIEGTPLYFNEHVERLFKSLELIEMHLKLSETELLNSIETLVKETGIINNNVRLEVGEDQNGVFTWILFWVKSHYPDISVYEKGVKTVTSKVTRDNPHAKIYRRQFVEAIYQIKQETGAYEVILVKEDGTITEGSRSNLFFIADDKLYAASENDVLMGITRQKLIALLNTFSIELIEKDIPLDTIDRFEACFITGTSIHLLPVNTIDKSHYKSADHPLYKKLETAFEKIVNDDLEHTRRLY